MSKLTYDDLKIPEFVYSRKIGNIGTVELDVQDALSALVLSGLSGIIVGHSEKGKSYFGKLVNRNYFGSKGIVVQGTGIEENTDLITQLCKKISKEDAKIAVRQDVIESPYWLVEELGAIPKQMQSMFYPIGDGILPHDGKEYLLGKDIGSGQRYFSLLATTNSIENGENADYGNFGISRAAASRFHICVDMRYYERSEQDLLDIGFGGFRDPRHCSQSEAHDISEKIFDAYREIRKWSLNPSYDELAALYYISIGGANCLKEGSHRKSEENWHLECMDCDKETECNTKYLNAFGLMRSNSAIGIYANALAYLAKLKNPDAKIDVADAVFLAARFGLSGKIGVVNPVIKKRDYKGREGQLISDAIDAIRTDYKENEKLIQASIDAAELGNRPTRFFEFNGKYSDFDKLDDKYKSNATPIDVSYTDNGSIGLAWFSRFLDKIVEKEKKK